MACFVQLILISARTATEATPTTHLLHFRAYLARRGSASYLFTIHKPSLLLTGPDPLRGFKCLTYLTIKLCLYYHFISRRQWWWCSVVEQMSAGAIVSHELFMLQGQVNISRLTTTSQSLQAIQIRGRDDGLKPSHLTDLNWR